MKKVLGWALLPLVMMACGPEDAGAPEQIEAPSWEVFKRASTKAFEGREIYVVDGDIAVDLAGLRAEYDRLLTDIEAYNLSIEQGIGFTASPSTVNVVSGHDDVWSILQAHNLTYCVSNEFGGNKSRMVSEMSQAAASLEAAGHLDFVYVPSQDGNCTGSNSNVVFAVRPWSSGGACAFFPSGGGCVSRTVVINITDIDTNPGYGNVTTVGVLRHELGHVLGLRHEHIRYSGTGCSESGSWRSLTTYDSSSMMHYPWCPGATNGGDLVVTALDASGIGQIYPPPPALNVSITRAGNPQVATAHVSGGVPPYTYAWYRKPKCSVGSGPPFDLDGVSLGGDPSPDDVTCTAWYGPFYTSPPNQWTPYQGYNQNLRVDVTDALGTTKIGYNLLSPWD